MFKFSRQPTQVLLSVTLCLLFLAGASVVAQDDKLNRAKEFYNEGVKAMQDGDPAAAVQAYESAIQMDPDYTDAHLNLGAIYFQQKAYDAAVASFRKVTELDPQNADAFANLGRVLYRTKNFSEAEAAFNSAVALDAGNAGLKIELGKTLYFMGKYNEAQPILEEGHAGGAADASSYYFLGKAYEKGEPAAKDKAVTAYKESINLNGNYYNSRSALGSVYLQQEKYRSAASQFKAAMNANPSRHMAAYNYAIAVESADPDNIDVNIANWEAFVRDHKKNPKATNQISVATSHVEDLKKRKEALELQ